MHEIAAEIINKQFVCGEDEKEYHQTNSKQNGVVEGGLQREKFITFSHTCALS